MFFRNVRQTCTWREGRRFCLISRRFYAKISESLPIVYTYTYIYINQSTKHSSDRIEKTKKRKNRWRIHFKTYSTTLVKRVVYAETRRGQCRNSVTRFAAVRTIARQSTKSTRTPDPFASVAQQANARNVIRRFSSYSCMTL